jgi:hypothetical protein
MLSVIGKTIPISANPHNVIVRSKGIRTAVENRQLVARIAQLAHQRRTDETVTANHKDSHAGWTIG